jgi:hypothetical protein
MLGERERERLQSIQSIKALKKLRQQIQSIWPNRKINQAILHDNARPHTTLRTRQATAIVR